MKTIKFKHNGLIITATVRPFLGMYQIISGSLACGIIRKDEVLKCS